ncbi:MAG: prolyl oligopeptidase family serine peptidase [Bacteroidetes bacterium]|nr:prolyl oligopeptidase family serine peptidase [Bacteroidota bacterium]
MKYAIAVIFFCAVMSAKLFAQFNYPYTKTVDSSDTYFGVTYKDPYRWMENLKDSNVVNWFGQQKIFADKTMKNQNGIDSLINQLSGYINSKTWGRSPVYRSDNRYYFSKGGRGQLNFPLYYRTINDTTAHFLFDTWAIQPGVRYNIAGIEFSPNEEFIAVAFDKNGEEYPFIKVYDIKNEKWLQDSIPHCWANTINWTADSKGFIYGYNTGNRNAPNATENDVVKYHTLFSNYATDKIIMDDKIRNTVEKKISNTYYASVYKNNSPKRIYCQPNQGFEFEYNNVYFINNSELLSTSKNWKKLYGNKDSVRTVIETDAGYYFVSAKGKGFKSFRFTSFIKPEFAHAKIIMPEDSLWQLENITESKSYVLVNYSKYGFINKTVFINKKTGKQVNVSAIDEYSRFFIGSLGNKTDECFFSKANINKPNWFYKLDIANNKLINDIFWAPQNQTILPGSDNIVSELIEVPSYDGTLVPMTILRNKNTQLDGNNVCILYGYGAYGIDTKDNSYNSYDPVNNLLAQRGVILVHAYVRGGGEKGEAWHQAGMKENKPNSWKDFIACAEYLIKNKYTQPAKLSCFGASAGGILIGRTIAERPDLFAAASIQSGSVNQIRGKAWANQISNYPEYGNPNIESEMKGLIEMDAAIHIKPNTKYPAMYITTGINDNRVAPWMPGKLAATLQANSTSGKPVLLYTNFEGGHFGDANAPTMIDRLKSSLKQTFFLLWQCGHKDFQMK